MRNTSFVVSWPISISREPLAISLWPLAGHRLAGQEQRPYRDPLTDTLYAGRREVKNKIRTSGRRGQGSGIRGRVVRRLNVQAEQRTSLSAAEQAEYSERNG